MKYSPKLTLRDRNLEPGTWNLELETELGTWNLELGTWNLKLNLEPGTFWLGGSVVQWLCSASCALFTLFLYAGCAKVGAPLPPITTPPETITTLEGVQVADRFLLTFSLPGGEIRSVQVERACGSSDLNSDPTSIARIARSDLSSYQGGNRFVFKDRPPLDRACRYALRFIDERERSSSLSNVVEKPAIPPANPPAELRYEIYEDRIHLTWKPPSENIDGSRPPHVTGYLVNSHDFVTRPEYIDREFQFGEPRSYRIQAVAQRSNPLILSGFSDTVNVVPKDEFPPAAPQNVTAIQLENHVRLVWDANREEDLEGYYIYRGTEQDRLKRLSELITVNSHRDESVESGETYFYQVSSVDGKGNESARSQMISVTID